MSHPRACGRAAPRSRGPGRAGCGRGTRASRGRAPRDCECTGSSAARDAWGLARRFCRPSAGASSPRGRFVAVSVPGDGDGDGARVGASPSPGSAPSVRRPLPGAAPSSASSPARPEDVDSMALARLAHAAATRVRPRRRGTQPRAPLPPAGALRRLVNGATIDCSGPLGEATMQHPGVNVAHPLRTRGTIIASSAALETRISKFTPT